MSESRKQSPETPQSSDEQRKEAPELATLTPEQEEKVKGGLASIRGPNGGVQTN